MLSAPGSSLCSRRTWALESADQGLNPSVAAFLALDRLKRGLPGTLSPTLLIGKMGRMTAMSRAVNVCAVMDLKHQRQGPAPRSLKEERAHCCSPAW